MSEIVYKVRRGDGLFYNPNKPGNRIDPTFDKKGKEYAKLSDAIKAHDFCESPVNDHWCWHKKKTPIQTDIVIFIKQMVDTGSVSLRTMNEERERLAKNHKKNE